MPAKSTNAPRPNRAWTMLGTPARFTTARLMMRVSQLFFAYSFRYTAASTPTGAAMQSEVETER